MIPIVEGKQKFKNLRILRRKNIHQNLHDIYAKYIDKMRKLTMSALHSWIVIDAFKIFIQPKLIFFFRNYKTAISYLSCSSKKTISEGTHRGLDYAIRDLIRRVTGHSQTASVDYLYAPIELGGCGLTSALDE